MNISAYDSKDGELVWAGKKISDFHRLFNRTPFYLYDRIKIQNRIRKLRDQFPKEIKLHYAVKANPKKELIEFLSPLVDGFDVASAGELNTIRHTRKSADEISIAGPAKSVEELIDAVKSEILISIESFREIEELKFIWTKFGKRPKVIVRINPNFELKGSGMKMGGGSKPFGIDSEMVPAAIKNIFKYDLDFFGFHIYSGSQNLKHVSIVQAQKNSYQLAYELCKTCKLDIRVLNLGGGFGIPYFKGESDLDLGPIAQNLLNLVETARSEMPKTKFIIELGRYLVGESGIYVCQVVDKKISRGKTFLLVNGGLHHHLAATGNLGQVIRRSYPIVIGNKINETILEEVSLAGPLCTPLDTFSDNILLPKAEIGDYLVLFQSGAYGATASPQDFLSHPRVLEGLF